MKKTNVPISRGGSTPGFPLRSILASTVLLATTAYSSADVTLKGNVGPRTINDDVIIAKGTTCVLNGTTIVGNVWVRAGATLITKGAWVDGSVFAYHADKVHLRNSTRVTWNVRGNATGSIILQEKANIGGHVRLRKCTAPEGMDALLVRNSGVVGDVFAEECQGSISVKYNTIEGNVKIIDNMGGKFSIHNNEIFKDLKFFRNGGQAMIVENKVGGFLESKGNTPNPTVKRNEVRGNTILN